MLRDSELLVDGAFMGRADWLEMCYYTVKFQINNELIKPKKFRLIAQSLPKTFFPLPILQFCCQNVCLNFVLTAFESIQRPSLALFSVDLLAQ